MEIRQAKVLDIPSIKSLADALSVKSNGLDKKTGFYDYLLTKDQYFNRITSPFFFVAENKIGLEGFCMAYNFRFVKILREQESSLKGDTISDFLNNLSEDYVYIDQLAARKPKTIGGSLAVYKLMDKTIDETKKAGISSILGAVAHNPWKNISAINFAKKLGFELQQEVNSKGVILGIYKLDI
jgi:hypothetical protein